MTKPNILFLISDEHSFRFQGHVSEDEGGEPVDTPTLDRLARQSTVFTDAYCQIALCTPSRICLLTGREARKAGAWDNGSVLRPELPTLAAALGEAGYETCALGKMHLGGNQQYAGFKHRPYGDLTGRIGHQWEPLDDVDYALTLRARTQHVGITGIPESQLQETIIAEETLSFLREHRHRNPDQPWFVYASFSRPHFPLTAPKRHIDRYYPDGVTEPKIGPTGDAYDHPMSVGARSGFKVDAFDYEEMIRARAAYFACVTHLDEILGDLLIRLQADGFLDNTIIVYASDHGEMAGEHNLWWKHTWHEASARVPLMISLPEQRDGSMASRRISTPVALIDLFPTLSTFAEASVPDDLDGINLSTAIQGKASPPDRPIFSDNLLPRWGQGTEYRMLRWQHYKYIRFRDWPALFFDLKNDPDEQHNLVKDALAGEAKDSLNYLQAFALSSMDFDAAEYERNVRDANLHDKYLLNVPQSTPNLFHMPSGKLVNAEDMLYHPTIISRNPENDLGDFPT